MSEVGIVIDYSGFIESMLDLLGKEGKIRTDRGYYKCQNPLTEDENPSSQWFYDTGSLKTWNYIEDGRDIFTPYEIALRLGEVRSLISFLLPFIGITTYQFNIFLDKNKTLRFDYQYYQVLNKLKMLSKPPHCIPMRSMMTSELMVRPKKGKYISKTKTTKSIMKISEATKKDLIEGIEYLEKREWHHIKGKCEPVSVSYNDEKSIPHISFTYPNGFQKIRSIKGKSRFICSGSYTCLYQLRTGESESLIVTEGEGECHSLINATDYDLMALHNCQAIAINNSLDQYENIYIFLDLDKFPDDLERDNIINKFSEYSDANIYVLPKFTDKFIRDNSLPERVDFNDYLINMGTKSLSEYISNKINIQGE